LRKRYQTNVESPNRDAPPVTAAPTTAAQPPEPTADTTPPEPIDTKSPAEQAEKAALKQRLAEMERAEQFTRQQMGAARQAQAQQQPLANEPPQQPVDPISALPERVQRWCRDNPQFLTDPEQTARLQYCHWVARREVGAEFTDPYFDRMEAMLGLRSAGNGHAQERPAEIDRPPAPAPRAAPVRRQQFSGPPVSAPPTRETPSLVSGRPPSDVRLTAEETQIAAASGISAREYLEQKRRMLAMKAAGTLTDGR
jgi:hypothetical protein